MAGTFGGEVDFRCTMNRPSRPAKLKAKFKHMLLAGLSEFSANFFSGLAGSICQIGTRRRRRQGEATVEAYTEVSCFTALILVRSADVLQT